MTQKVKIRVVGFLNSFTEGASGGDVAFIEIMKRSKNIELTILTSELGKRLCLQRGLNARFVITTDEESFHGVLTTYTKRILIGCFKSLFIRKPDIIYVSSDVMCDVLPAIVMKVFCLIRLHPVKVLQKYFHINNPNRKLSSFMQRISFRLFHLYTDRVSTCSEISKKHIESLGISLPAVSVNHLGIDFDGICKIPSLDKVYDAVFLGRLQPSKGIFDIPEIWRRVVERNPAAKLALIGDGPEEIKSRLRSELAKHKILENVDFLGFHTGHDAYRILKSSTIFLFPSHEEGFGIVLAEAMACGNAVVAYDLPVYRECFGGSLVSVPKFDMKLFAEEVMDLLADTEKRSTIISKGMKTAQSLDWNLSTAREWQIINSPKINSKAGNILKI